MILGLVSCQEEVYLEVGEGPELPVIEGIWTNNSIYNQVRVTRTKNYYDSASYRPIADANVYLIYEENARKIRFEYSEQTKTYLPVFNEEGRPGRRYSLHVEIGQNHYRSSGILLESPQIDSLSYVYKEERAFRPKGYYLKVHGKIPFAEDNFYRIRVNRNDTLLTGRSDYLLFDDTFGTAAFENGFELESIPFRKGDEARLSVYRLNESAYDYLQGMLGLLYNDGGLFTPPPQNPISNIELLDGDRPALGYFMVGSVKHISRVIE
ncbi:hypothetical protein GCM10007049_25840 [Echinicola pacifica]|uniref:DUF4249 domain-containing protein n=2 Tax=Echinicola pacifica TaxID=346377 RepID=A0A918Q2R8_9BACT|nr:hypothetical protein GCM10007049_25840 [Echinicola pacifica]